MTAQKMITPLPDVLTLLQVFVEPEVAERILQFITIDTLDEMRREDEIELDCIGLSEKLRNIRKLLGEIDLEKQSRLAVDVDQPSQIANIVRSTLALQRQEMVVLAPITHDGKLAALHMLNIGTQTSTPVDLRGLVEIMVMADCYQCYIFHNHPFEDVPPSPADQQSTANLHALLKNFGVNLLDSIVIGKENNYYILEAYKESARAGRMQPPDPMIVTANGTEEGSRAV